ncbi:MAG: bifunctional phosphopantothenoylcysteine decarboxylase/phosphopantothenate--cysteine ligase CoaBC [Coriobacteriales bacterium]|jgi:phosphopantothenoylcysteine decarboxylase/phosphopantothenate--cysteine ligase|nr:bifunctional phosphopantothenoylcysteine decarboxylase/phosphopantothenate--cysteine ligase CoaBC [Coriobacteriales bacterium]
MPAQDHEQTILLGVTGCIAAYKACELVRLYKKAGKRVKVVMTPMGTEFVTPATFRTLSEEPVALKAVDDPNAAIQHIVLAQEADVFVIAPATANTINKLAHGVGDNLLTTTALATGAPLLIAPAMNVHMWRDETTQASLVALRERGAIIIEPESGYLACGDTGEGRLASVEEIFAATIVELDRARSLEGKRILVTAGPTREFLDPVRFISSPSSGITGYAIAEEAARRGAEVVLISGPVELPDPFGCTVIRVQTAQQMLAAAERHFKDLDAAIFTAAVSDFRPEATAQHKVKKKAASPEVRLVQNPDILATLAARVGADFDTAATPVAGSNPASSTAPAPGADFGTHTPFIVGFAAETQDVIEQARQKLIDKHADLIVANDVSSPTLGFASTHNRWHFVTAERVETSAVLSKKALASLLLDKL